MNSKIEYKSIYTNTINSILLFGSKTSVKIKSRFEYLDVLGIHCLTSNNKDVLNKYQHKSSMIEYSINAKQSAFKKHFGSTSDLSYARYYSTK